MARRNSDRTLDYWRKFFRCADKDIILVIMSAITVAKSDHPRELIANRQAIIDSLYPRDKPELIQNADEAESRDNKRNKRARETEESNNESEDQNLYESKCSNGEIEEQHQTEDDQVMKIKEVLANWQHQPTTVLLESLRRLQLMRVSLLETVTATDMIRVLNGLQNHPSKQVSRLAQTLIEDWRLLSPEWTNFSATFQENIQDLAHHLSPAKDDSQLPSPPFDVEFFQKEQHSPFDLSRFFDDVDDDGNPRNTTSELEKNERQDQIDNDLEDGEISPDWLLPQAFHEEATISSNTHGMQEPVEDPPSYLQDVPKTCKELSYDSMAEKIERKAQMVNINLGRKENGEMMMMMREQDITPPKSMQAFNQEANVGSNDQKMQKHFEISNQSKKSSHQEKIVENTRKSNVSSIEPMWIKNVEMRVQEAGILPLKPAKVAVRPTKPLDTSWQVPARPLLQEKAKVNGNSQKRQEHYAGPSKPSFAMLDVSKQFKESSSPVKLEKNERKAQPSRINAERKVNGMMTIHEENKLLKPTKAGQLLQQPNGSPSKPFNKKANVDRNTLKRQELIEATSKTSPLLHDVPSQSNESAYQHKVNATKRKIQESYRHLDNAKKKRSVQLLELKELRIFGIRRTQ